MNRLPGFLMLVACLVLAPPELRASCVQNLPNDVPVGGPFTVTVGADGKADVRRDFQVDVPQGAFDLIVGGGDAAIGQNAPDSVAITLNGCRVVRESHWRCFTPLLVTCVGLRRDNDLRIVVNGTPGTTVTVMLRRSGPCRTAPGGGWRVIRATGKPKMETRHLALDVLADRRFHLVVINGEASGSGLRATSGRVWFNGREVFSPNDFKHKAAVLCAPVTVQANNRIDVELAGTPTDEVTIFLVAESTRVNTVTFGTAASQVDEHVGPTRIPLVLTYPAWCPLPVAVTTVGESAHSGSDYHGYRGVLWFPAGSTQREAQVAIIDDSISEPEETFLLRLMRAHGACLGQPKQHRVTIVDNDHAPTVATVAWTEAASVVDEADVTVHAGLTLSASRTHPVVVTYSVDGIATPGLDHDLEPGTITIPPGETVASLPLPIRADALYEGDETVVLTIVAVDGANPGIATVHTLTIRDTDVPPTVALLPTEQVVAESAGSVQVTVRLSTVSGLPVTVPLELGGTATPELDFTGIPASLTIPAGTSEAVVTIDLIDDALHEHAETVTITLADPRNAVLGDAQVATITIIDDDVPPTVRFVSATTMIAESIGAVSVALELSAPSGRPVAVPITIGGTATPGLDHTFEATVVHFAPGEVQTVIAGTILDDVLPEADETIVLMLGAAEGAQVGEPNQHTVTILNDDAPASITFALAASVSAEAAGTASIQVVLDRVSGHDVTATIVTAGTAIVGDAAIPGIDAIVPGSVIIPAGSLSANVVVSIIDDDLHEGDESIILTLVEAAGGLLGERIQHELTIIDDDALPVISFAIPTTTVDETAGVVPVCIVLNHPSSQEITVGVTAAGTATRGEDYLLSVEQAVFPAGVREVDLLLTILDDNLVEDPETIILTLVAPIGATLGVPVQHQVTIISDDQSLLRPIAECLEDNGDGTVTVFFGYEYGGTEAIGVGIGPQNRFLGARDDRGQVVRFLPGRSPLWPDHPFSAVMPEDATTWQLGGLAVDATRDLPTAPVVPFLPPRQIPPRCTIIAPVDGSRIESGTDVAVVVDAVDPDGIVTLVEIRLDDIVVASLTPEPGQPVVAVLADIAPGAHALIARAVDDHGLETTSAPVILHLHRAPTVAIVADTDLVTLPGTLAVTVTVDPGDAPLAELIVRRNGEPIATSEEATVHLVLDPVLAPAEVLTATATDTEGFIGHATRTVLVNHPPQVALLTPVAGAPVQPRNGVVPLMASASDADGQVERVRFVIDGLVVAELTAGPWRWDWPVGQAATAELIVEAVDDHGAVARSEPVVIAINLPPTVTVISPADGAVLAVDAVATFTAEAADAEGALLAMVLLIDDERVAESATGSATVPLPTAQPGIVWLAAEAYDRSGGYHRSAPISVRINAPPLAVLTAPTSGTVPDHGSAVVVSGQASDSDGTILHLDFRVDGVSLGTVAGSIGTVSWTPERSGIHRVEVIATDNDGGIHADGRNITVNDLPVVTFTDDADAVPVLGRPFTVAAFATDSDGTIQAMRLFAEGDLLAMAAGSPITTTWTPATSGAVVLAAEADDDRGAQARSERSVVVNIPPTVALLEPTPAAVLPLDQLVRLGAQAGDLDGNVVQVSFYAQETLLGSAGAAPFQLDAVLPSGAYALTAVAQDDRGTTTTSSPVPVRINAPPSIALRRANDHLPLQEGGDVLLIADATDEDGVISAVTFWRDDTVLGTVTAAPYQWQVPTVAAGEHRFVAIVSDNDGATASATLVVNANAQPRVTLTYPVFGSVLPAGGLLTFTAEAIDPDGAVTHVAYLAGRDGAEPTEVNVGLAHPYPAEWVPPQPGVWTLIAVAYDDRGASGRSAPVEVVVNAAPTATLTITNGGVPYDPDVGLILAATADDIDGTIVEVRFLQDGEVFAIDSEAPYGVAWTGADRTSRVLVAEAVDDRGAIGRSNTITVALNAAPRVTVLAPLSGQIFHGGSGIVAEATITDEDSGIAQAVFRLDGADIATLTEAPWRLTLPTLAPGDHELVIIASDTGGLTTTTTPVVFRVNALPTVALTAPAAGSLIAQHAPFTITADAADSDGTIQGVEFFAGSTFLGADLSAPYEITTALSVSGTLPLRAEVIDDRGARVVSAPVAVTVNAAPLVSLTAPVGGAVIPFGAPVTVTAHAIDSDGSVTSVVFYAGGTALGTVTAAPWQITVPDLPAGSIALSAVATDDRGATARSAWVQVSITPPGTDPPDLEILSPVHGSIVLQGEDVPFIIAASDPDGVVESVTISLGDTVLATLTSEPWNWTWVAPPAGRHRLAVVATDDAGSTRSISGWTVIVNQPPQVTITAPSDGAVILQDTETLVQVAASDSDGQVVEVQLQRDGLEIGQRLAAPYDFTLATDVAGAAELVAVARDELGTITLSTPVRVIVNAPPTISLLQPVSDQVHRLGEPLVVEAAPADPDNGVSAVEIRIDGRLSGTLTAPPWSLSVSGIPLGSHVVEATVIDALGARTASDAVPFRTSAPPSVALSAPTAGTLLAAGALTTLSAQATDPDGTVALVRFLVDGVVVASDHSAPFSVPWLVAGTGSVTLRAEAVDDTGLTALSTPVVVAINARPVVTVTAPTSGAVFAVGEAVPVTATASDPGGTVAELRLLIDNQPLATLPASEYSSTVLDLPAGSHTLRVEATDNQGATAEPVLVRFTVGDGNLPPQVAIAAPALGDSVPRGQATTLTTTVADADGRVIAVRFFADDVLLGETTSEPFTWDWIPPVNGTVVLRAEAVDDGGATTLSDGVTVSVDEPSADALRIVIVEPAGPRRLAVGQALVVRAEVTGATALERVEFLLDGVVVATDAQAPFEILLPGQAAGNRTLTARAVDYGRSTLSLPIALTVAADSGAAPTVAITDPSAPGLVVGLSHTVHGRVVSTNPAADIARWTLSLREGEDGTLQEIASGIGPVDGALGVLDATLLRNGRYHLELMGLDSIGRYVIASQSVAINGQAKVGEFAVSFTDLVVPVGGIPLAMLRTYRSFDRTVSGDFGYGWTSSLTDLQISLDERRAATVSADFSDFSKRTGGSRDVTLTLPDTGKRVTFRYELMPAGVGRLEARWHAPAGETAILAPIGNARVISLFTSPPYWEALGPYSANDFEAFDVAGWTLYLADGTQYRIERDDHGTHLYTAPNGATGATHAYGVPRLVSITQTSGDRIAIGSSQIEHRDPTGAVTRRLHLTRDGQGRITTIHAPDAQDEFGAPQGPASVVYTYSTDGDLIAVAKLVGVSEADGEPVYETSTYHYELPQFPHYLTRIVDPNGSPARMEYDASGRLVALIDGDGNRTELSHDAGARTQQISDALGNVRQYVYDTGGNVVAETDPLGRTTTRSYDGQGHMLTETDPLGRTTRYTYDAKGNQTSVTDALGHTTMSTYDSRGNVLSITDALGRTTQQVYDAQDNLLSLTDAAGNVTTFTYTPAGKLATETDALGNVTHFVHDSSGNMTQTTDALGNVTTFTYDANGNQTGQRRTRTLADGSTEVVVTQTRYDSQGRVTRVMDALGNVTVMAYTATGNVGQVTDALGRTTRYVYDSRGNLIRVEYPDGTSESTVFDALGRRTAATDRAGRVTTFVYDAAGRMTAVTGPDGTVTRTEYDAAGQVIAQVAADGSRTTYAYDAVGRQLTVTDAAGVTTTTTYDAVGQVTAMTDGAGATMTFGYDVLGRQTHTTLPDGTGTSTQYDALSRRIGETDALGRVTTFGYDALGRLTTVTDAAGQVTAYAYDEVGNQVSQTDALGRVTTFAYDAAGRRTQRRLPLGMVETSVYDALGRLVSQTDFNGRTTTQSYDTANRVTAIIPDPALGEPTIAFAYAPDGRRTQMVDAVGTTTYAYDAAGRLTARATPIGTVRYGYDAAGRLVATTTEQSELPVQSTSVPATTLYGYDAAGRLSRISGMSAGTTTHYQYGATGALAQVQAANGVATAYQYDTVGRLTNVLSVDADASPVAQYGYQLRANAHRARVTELSGRSATYAYDVLDRLVSETIAGATSGSPNGQVTYSMDAVGNRLSRTSTVPGVADQTLAYDANDRLASSPYTYDANGNTRIAPGVTTNPDTYTFHNRLRRRVGDDGVVVELLYDGDGHKIGERVDGVTTWFLLDLMNPTGYAQTLEERIGVWDADAGRLTDVRVRRSYQIGLDLIAQTDVTRGIRFFGYDGHGSVRYLTNAIGEVTDTFDYDAYGVLLHRTGVTECRYTYAGEEIVGSLNLGYNRARYLDQGTGRFWTMDAYEGRYHNPLTLHKYAYAHSNSINGIDPTGYMTIGELFMSISFGDTMRVSQGMTQTQIRKQVVNQILEIMKDQAADAIMEGVYVLAFGPAGELLYVGETNDMERRLKEHSSGGTKWQKRARRAGEIVADQLTPRIVGFLKLAPVPDLPARTNKFIRNVVETMILESVNETGANTMNANSSVAKNSSIAKARLGRHSSRMSPELRRQFIEFFNLLGR